MLAAPAIALGSPCPSASRPQTATALWALDNSSLLALLTHGYPQLPAQCQESTPTHSSEPQAPCLAILLAPGGFPSHRTWRPSTLHCPWQQESSCFPVKEQECQIPHRMKKSYNLLLCRQHQKSWSPKIHRRPALHTHLPKGESCLYCPRAGIPAPAPSGNHYCACARRPTSTQWTETHAPHYDCRRAPSPHKRVGTPAPSLKGENR
jgi:hypothetical protein